jgi:hypothetical protein
MGRVTNRATANTHPISIDYIIFIARLPYNTAEH